MEEGVLFSWCELPVPRCFTRIGLVFLRFIWWHSAIHYLPCSGPNTAVSHQNTAQNQLVPIHHAYPVHTSGVQDRERRNGAGGCPIPRSAHRRSVNSHDNRRGAPSLSRCSTNSRQKTVNGRAPCIGLPPFCTLY